MNSNLNEEFWEMTVTFQVRKKDSLNAFQSFQEGVLSNLIEMVEKNSEINFVFGINDMQHHLHNDNGCTVTPLSKEDVDLIMKLTLPLDVLKRIEKSKAKYIAKTSQCTECNGTGKRKFGELPILEIMRCTHCNGTGKKPLIDEDKIC